jgi:hypothetical protein
MIDLIMIALDGLTNALSNVKQITSLALGKKFVRAAENCKKLQELNGFWNSPCKVYYLRCHI